MHIGENINPATLSAMADSTVDDALREELKLTRSRRNAKVQGQVDAARGRIEKNKQAANERLQAAKDRLGGGFLGFLGKLFGILGMIASLFASFTGVGAALAPALGGIGKMLTGMAQERGAKKAIDKEQKAVRLDELAQLLGLKEMELDKGHADLTDAERETRQRLTQLYQDARTRERDRNQIFMA